jgi:hypothetical protein
MGSRWLFVRVGFVWRLLAAEAVLGEGRVYGFMVWEASREVCDANKDANNGLGSEWEEWLRSLWWEKARTDGSHHGESRRRVVVDKRW